MFSLFTGFRFHEIMSANHKQIGVMMKGFDWFSFCSDREDKLYSSLLFAVFCFIYYVFQLSYRGIVSCQTLEFLQPFYIVHDLTNFLLVASSFCFSVRVAHLFHISY
ncbi:unnamed protein product [Ilex paraguariensis]|uniref:Uncharacterized protein n=1 Tax=Ilex paraguariensis TaxID=185542 RepID=A0ABC8RPL6_9AQUA